MASINEFRKGDLVVIETIDCEQKLRRRLCELGLFEGAKVEIIKNDRKSPVLIKVFNSKIVLDQKGAQKIYGEKI